MTEDRLMECQMVVEEYFQECCIELLWVHSSFQHGINVKTVSGHVYYTTIDLEEVHKFKHLKFDIMQIQWMLTHDEWLNPRFGILSDLIRNVLNMTEDRLIEGQIEIEAYFQSVGVEVSCVDINIVGSIHFRTYDGYVFSIYINLAILDDFLGTKNWILHNNKIIGVEHGSLGELVIKYRRSL